MDLTEGSETSANINQTPGKHLKVDTVNTEHGESLKSRTLLIVSKVVFCEIQCVLTVSVLQQIALAAETQQAKGPNFTRYSA
jgi:hypothetical protein